MKVMLVINRKELEIGGDLAEVATTGEIKVDLTEVEEKDETEDRFHSGINATQLRSQVR